MIPVHLLWRIMTLNSHAYRNEINLQHLRKRVEIRYLWGEKLISGILTPWNLNHSLKNLISTASSFFVQYFRKLSLQISSPVNTACSLVMLSMRKTYRYIMVIGELSALRPRPWWWLRVARISRGTAPAVQRDNAFTIDHCFTHGAGRLAPFLGLSLHPAVQAGPTEQMSAHAHDRLFRGIQADVAVVRIWAAVMCIGTSRGICHYLCGEPQVIMKSQWS